MLTTDTIQTPIDHYISFDSTRSTSDLNTTLQGGVLASLDEQVQGMAADFQIMDKEKSILTANKQKLNSDLAACQSAVTLNIVDGAGNPITSGEYIVLNSAAAGHVEDLANQFGISLTPAFETHPDGKKCVSKSELESLKESVEDRLAHLNSAGERQMLRYQQILDARKQAMLILSNTLNSDHQTKMAILNNLKG